MERSETGKKPAAAGQSSQELESGLTPAAMRYLVVPGARYVPQISLFGGFGLQKKS
jgi:hypothetical protein